jgi:hypothetical protein
LACHLQTVVDPDPATDPAYHFDADPHPNFYLMRMRIKVTKMMRIHLDPDPQHWPQLRIRIRGPAFILNHEMEIKDSPEIKKIRK